MDEESIKKVVENISYDDLKILRKEATRKLSNVRKRDRLYFRLYLQKEYVEDFERALDYAFEKGLILKRTRWAFTKFCVVNVIKHILEDKKKEELLAQQMQASKPLFALSKEGEGRQN